MEELKKEFEFYLRNQEELVKKYNGRVIVIKGETVLGDYDSELQAFEKTSLEHRPGTFLIQKCTPGKDAYTRSFHSRVMMA
jgi:hypothetical protein